jgi:restriction endonuclease S subunit
VAATAIAHAFPVAALGDICEINPESLDPAKVFASRQFEYIDIAAIENETGNYLGSTQIIGIEAPSRARRKVQNLDVLLSTVRPNLRAFALLRNPPENAVASTGFAVLRAKSELVLPGYLIWLLRSEPCVNQMVAMSGKGAYPSINSSDVECITIPLPPLEVQHQIVAEIQGYQKVIDGARQVVDNYKPQIAIGLDWVITELGQICENMDSKRSPVTKSDRVEGAYPYYGASGIVDYVEGYLFDEPLLLISEDGANLLARSTPIAFSVEGKVWVNNHAHVLRFKELATQKYVEFFINSIDVSGYVTGSAQPKLNQAALSSIKIPLPNLKTQRAIVAEIEAEQTLVNANRELIRRMEAKIKTAIDRVWSAA